MDEAASIWDENAAEWDALMGDGNVFHEKLVVPAQLLLIGDQTPNVAIEFACGNGNFLRHLASRAGKVIGVDSSQRMLSYATARISGHSNCSIVRRDLVSDDLLSLAAPGSVDLIVCTMALMDISALGNMAAASSVLLTAGGTFVATFAHPAFWGPSPRAERCLIFRNDVNGTLEVPAVTVYAYRSTQRLRARAERSLPSTHIYFARPLEDILDPFFSEGLVMDRLLEPTFPGVEEFLTPSRPDEWRRYAELPPIMAIRLRRR